MNNIEQLHNLGQSIWYDNIERKLLQNGDLAAMVARGDIRGITSNPSIFNNAISNSKDYDEDLTPLALAGKSKEEIYETLAVADIQTACDLFRPLYEETQGGDGYVSLEVSPYLAKDTAATIAEARRLWELVDRPNVMIKIPATREGLPAITKAIAHGINVNVTLIFSIERYEQVMNAYMSGLEQRLNAGNPIQHVASVASFFVSRIDTNVDQRLNVLVDQGKILLGWAGEILGKAAIASAKLAFDLHKKVFSAERWQNLKAKGGRVQRALWASTSTKNPAYPETMYIDELIGPDTVNTVPPQTLVAFADHGKVKRTLDVDVEAAQAVMDDLAYWGISMKVVTQELEDQGVKSFADAFTALLESIEARRVALFESA